MVCEQRSAYPRTALRTGCLGRFGACRHAVESATAGQWRYAKTEVVPHDLPNLFEESDEPRPQKGHIVAVSRV